MKKKTRKKKRTVAERAADHVDLIDRVFGGRLYPFRSYRETPGEADARLSSSPAAPPSAADAEQPPAQQ